MQGTATDPCTGHRFITASKRQFVFLRRSTDTVIFTRRFITVRDSAAVRPAAEAGKASVLSRRRRTGWTFCACITDSIVYAAVNILTPDSNDRNTHIHIQICILTRACIFVWMHTCIYMLVCMYIRRPNIVVKDSFYEPEFGKESTDYRKPAQRFTHRC